MVSASILWGSGALPPAGSRGRAPGQGVGAKPPKADRLYWDRTPKIRTKSPLSSSFQCFKKQNCTRFQHSAFYRLVDDEIGNILDISFVVFV